MSNQMIWGFSGKPAKIEEVVLHAGVGWKNIVQSLIDDLFQLGWDGQLYQVKEKFGGLRFYIGAGSEEIWKRISKAEAESQSTCIECGEPGKIYDDGWMLALCPFHAAKAGRSDD